MVTLTAVGATEGGPGVTYRVVQWATGGVGRAAVEGLLRHPDLELVGCWVHSPEKAGLDVGSVPAASPNASR